MSVILNRGGTNAVTSPCQKVSAYASYAGVKIEGVRALIRTKYSGNRRIRERERRRGMEERGWRNI